jgi:RNA polymerase sigma-70 factor, ECF subfamily
MNFLDSEQIVAALFAHRARLSASIWLIVRDVHLAEDVFQEVAVKAAGQADMFQNTSHLLSWCHVTARNAAFNLLRARKKPWETLDETLIERLEAEWTAEGAMADRRIEALQDCLSALPAESRRALALRYAECRSCSEVAAHLGLKLEAAYQRLSRLHLTLRQCVERKSAKPESSPT